MELRSSCLAAGAFAGQIISLAYIIKLKHKLVFLHPFVHSIHLNQPSLLPFPLPPSLSPFFPSYGLSLALEVHGNTGLSPLGTHDPVVAGLTDGGSHAMVALMWLEPRCLWHYENNTHMFSQGLGNMATDLPSTSIS